MQGDFDRWTELLARRTTAGTDNRQNSLGADGEETATRVLEKAQESVSRFTVAIGKTGVTNAAPHARDLVRGSGVIVKLDDGRYGVLTAAHVLKYGDNTRDSATVTLLALSREQTKQGEVNFIELPPRPCAIDGINNESQTGPDIAFIPITSEECSALEGWGMVAYNLEKERWSDEDTARFGEITRLVSVIHGVRVAASEIVERHAAKQAGSLALMTTTTAVKAIEEIDGHDYLELPSKTTEDSSPTHWKDELPGTAAKDIEKLHDEGVTRTAWGGTSGAGVWNLAIGTDENGVPSGKVFAGLTGICFYASPDKGCVIAHGPKSITRVAGLTDG